MKLRGVLLGLLVALPSAAFEPQGKAKDKGDVTNLSLEVDALQTLYLLDLTPAQLKAMSKLAQNTAKQRTRQPAKVSKNYHATLLALRSALIKNEGLQVDELNDRLDKLRETEQPQIDGKFETTDAARKNSRAALRLLTTRQVTDYLSSVYEDDVPDPLDRVVDAAQKGAGIQGLAWKQLRDDAAEEVAGWVAGFDTEKSAKVREQVAALLDKAHAWSAEEVKKNQPVLEQAVQEIMGEVGPFDVLRNVVEHDLAELLSNPQLPAALESLSREGK